jgi:2-amino-4-hydroxy-6-hydroxymethyldihydropteridine diphosphokinase
MPHIAFIGLGSNLGNSRQTLSRAVDEIASLPKTRLVETSAFIQTKPFGVSRRMPDFWNAAVEIETELSPDALLSELRRVEREHGRKRPYRFAPRSLDLDILLYDDRIRRGRRVILPHPRLHLRAFALKPLFEIAPKIKIPGKFRGDFQRNA